jgi:uncharacterized protein (TIGR03083 family)
VHDIVAHVAHDHIRKLSGARDGQFMTGPLPEESLADFLNRANQEFVDVARNWSPRVLIDLLGHLGPELDRFWATLDLDELGEPVSWAAPDEPAPHWLDIAREYTEYWVHQQQVRDAVGRPGANTDQLTEPVIDTFIRAVPYALRRVPPEPGMAVQIDVTGPGSGSWTIAARDGAWFVDRGSSAAGASAVIQLSSDMLWRVATRGIEVETALKDAQVTGDETLATAALSLLSIIR